MQPGLPISSIHFLSSFISPPVFLIYYCSSFLRFCRPFSLFLQQLLLVPFPPPFPEFTSFLNCLSLVFPHLHLLSLNTPVILHMHLISLFSVLRAHFLIASSPCLLKSSTYLIYVCHKSSLHSSFLSSAPFLYVICKLHS